MIDSYVGQWRGDSDSGVHILVNIEQDGTTIFGKVSTFQTLMIDDADFQFWNWSDFRGTVSAGGVIQGELKLRTVHHKYGELLTDQEINTLKQKTGIEFPVATKFKGTRNGEYEVVVEAISHYPTVEQEQEKYTLKRERLGGSLVHHEKMSWKEFKNYILQQEDGVVYRGQARHWRLQTSFHREGGADLIAYLDNKIPEVERYINSVSSHPYNSADDRSLGALLNLAQHHGYPTPLLDWTRSPYVAAFFAFENKQVLKKDGTVSIFVFNEKKWVGLSGRIARLRVPNMVIRSLELPGFGNSRVLPQQSLIMYSNVSNIESVIKSNEENPGDFLQAISIPTSEREFIMKDLNLMGINWASMFPGFDGVCKQLRVKHFSK